MQATAVDRLNDEFGRLLQFLDRHGSDTGEQYTLRNFANESLGKMLLLSAASYFERHLVDSVERLSNDCLSSKHPLHKLIVKEAITGKYHTWFAWRGANANKFLSLFGEDFKEYAAAKINRDPALQSSIRSFLEIGRERNRLIHGDVAASGMQKTSKEIYELYSHARQFVEWFPEAMREHLKSLNSAA